MILFSDRRWAWSGGFAVVCERPVREKSKSQDRIQAALELSEQRVASEWLDIDKKAMKVIFKSTPERSELPSDINEHLVVELYSK